MPINVVFNREELKNVMVNAGWDDVVAGNNFVTWSSGMSRVPRFGYWIIYESYGFRVCGVYATSHVEGQEPSGWNFIYSVNAYIQCYGGMVVYHYPNEAIVITSLYSGTRAGFILFAKTYDPVTGEFTGWFVTNQGGNYPYAYAYGLSYTYSGTLFTCPTTYISKFATIHPQTYTGKIRGILYDQGTFEVGCKIGDEKYARLRGNWLVRV